MIVNSEQERLHIFVCTNERKKGKCCGSQLSQSVFDYLRQTVNKKRSEVNDKLIKVTKTGCLGRCAKGPNLTMYPDNVWCSYQSIDDVKQFVGEYLMSGETAVETNK